MVGVFGGGGGGWVGFVVDFLLRAWGGGGAGGGLLLVCEAGGGGGGDDGGVDAVGCEVLLCVEVALAPFSGRGVRAEDQHADCGEDDDDEGHDESHAPCHMVGESVFDEAVEDGGHQEIGNATTGVAEAAGQCIGCADHVLVEEACGPNLAGHETAAENADEETQCEKLVDGVSGAGEGGRDSTDEEDSSEGLAGTNPVTRGTGDETDDEAVTVLEWVDRDRQVHVRSGQSDDIGIGDVDSREREILLDRHAHERWEGVPTVH